MNMNNSTGKLASWIVRVLDPKLAKYDFTARGEVVHAEKFQCVLVSDDPAQYMLGLVQFSFNNRNAAGQALKKFVDKTNWEIKNPAFDPKQKKEFISTPVKRVVFLDSPTKVRAIAPTEIQKYQYPVKYQVSYSRIVSYSRTSAYQVRYINLVVYHILHITSRAFLASLAVTWQWGSSSQRKRSQ